ncbi:MAG: LysE family translocator [Desulfurella sp.]|uniref:L-lysine exporter family protein LysE/ArgO n=1 Tax=Desulfurella multipotens TaxID=79269 RepID=A0A1G6I0C5_9BACT|nr:LysE family translocator [Desulfurella multipotens]SDB99525.1 L-lysine exporter family protein LysE/ArgO [Desulfurella multipotens]
MSIIGSFVSGFILGAGASVPIGPINILIINEALVSYRNAFLLGLGAMCADITYLTLIFFGIFVNIKEQSVIFRIISLLGGVFLIYLAYRIFKSRIIDSAKLKTQIYFASPFKSYSKGYILTILNPYTILFWTSMLAYIGQNHLQFSFTLIGLICAIMIWISLMPFFVYKTKSFFSQKVSVYVNILSALIIFGFGISILLKLILHY